MQAVIAKLDPRDGVEPVFVTDEEEYFPPPRELRELLPTLDTVAALLRRRRPRGGPQLGRPVQRATEASTRQTCSRGLGS